MSGLPVRRLVSFVGLQGLAAVVPLLVLPAINAIVGAQGWVALSIGYGVGTAAAVVSAYSWPVLGPHRVAGADPGAAAWVYWESLITRCAAWLVAAVAGALAAALLVEGSHRVLAVSMAVAVTSWGMTPSWFFVGRGDARSVARYETIPRLISSAAAIPLISMTGQPLIYPVLVLAASAGSLMAATRRIMKAAHASERPAVPWRAGLADHASLTAAGLIGTGYTSLVLPVARSVHPGTLELSNLAAATRIRGMAQMGTAAVATGLQGWASEGESDAVKRAHRRRALAATSAIGVITALVLALILPFVGHWLFGDVSDISWGLSVATATACIPYAMASSLSFHVLAPLGRSRVISTSRIAATFVGVPAIAMGAGLHGAVGALIGTALAECVVVFWQLWSVWSYLFPPHPRGRHRAL